MIDALISFIALITSLFTTAVLWSMVVFSIIMTIILSIIIWYLLGKVSELKDLVNDWYYDDEC